MRKFTLVALLALAATLGLATARGAGDGRVSVRSGVSLRLPAGWHLVRGRGTPVLDPIPRLAAATFPVRFSRQYCVCETPHVANLPRAGAFLFVWEYPGLGRRGLRAFPRRPARFRIGPSASADACSPSDTVLFRQGQRAFQVQIYLGPAAPAAARAQIAAILDSWHATPGPTRRP
jgi:hypothetical protein